MESLRQYEKSLVNGYFMLHFANYTPHEIIKICVYYCFVLDEFVPNISTNMKLKGINNSIATLHPPVPHDTNSESLVAMISTRNIIKSATKYHWTFTITNSKKSTFEFRLVDNNNCKTNKATSASVCFWDSNRNDTFTLHIYLDTELKKVTNKCGNSTEQKNITAFDEINDCRLFLQIYIPQNVALPCPTIEMLEYHASNLYIQQLVYNPDDAMANVGYANCIYDIKQEIKCYAKALSVLPYVELWNDKYLNCLMDLGQYDVAYNHALQFKKGHNAMVTLIAHYYDKDKYANSYKLLMLLEAQHLHENDLYFEIAFCCSKAGDSDGALKYYAKYLAAHDKDEGDENRENISICIGNMARLHCRNDRYEEALDSFLVLPQKEIDERNVNDDIAYCYKKTKQYEKAQKYYELNIKNNPNDPWGYKQISYLFDEVNDHKTESQYLLKALHLSTDNEQKGDIYTSLGVNEYLERNLKNAIDFGEKAIECFNETDVEDAKVITLSNLGKYYYKIGEYDTSFKLLSEAITIDSEYISCIGNYAIILYYLSKFDESIIYLKKCIERKEEMKDFEMLPDCLYIYAKILYDTHEFNQSEELCLQAIDCDYFQNYKDKHQIYKLMSDNYAKLLQNDKAQQYLTKANQCK